MRRAPRRLVELRDRANVIFGRGNIASIEVEQAIMDHPAVLEAAVIAVPDERWARSRRLRTARERRR